MLSETGRVISLENDGVWVETLQQTACSSCRAKHGCGQRLLASADSRLTCIKAIYPDKPLPRQPELGDAVTIGVQEQALVKGAVFSYGLPLSLMLLLTAVASLVTDLETLIFISASAGLFLGGLIVRKLAHTLSAEKCLQAVLLDVNQNHLPAQRNLRGKATF